MKTFRRVLTSLLVVTVVLVSLWLSLGPAAASGNYNCLPTCSTTDGRMLSIWGSGLSTLAGSRIHFGIQSAGQASVDVGFFDGNAGGIWDYSTFPLTYRLYADPSGDGSGETAGNLVRSWSSSELADNVWQQFGVPNDSRALATDGSYRYVMVVTADDAGTMGYNSFKLRADALITLFKAKPFGFVVPMNTTADRSTIYPSYPDLTNTTYDGTWNFFFSVPDAVTWVEVWDGDLDFGRWDCTVNDSDDPGTNGGLPWWSAGTPAVTEGVAQGTQFCPGSTSAKATGAPFDDHSNELMRRSPDVTYRLVDALGNQYVNSNPSGNLEWERFRVSSEGGDPAADAFADWLPTGLYRVNIQGMDLSNLNAWWFNYAVLGITEHGEPSFTIGDTVWYDKNDDGTQQSAEPGIGGVTLNLRDGTGALLGSTTTDANGHYKFDVSVGGYTVTVAPENFTGTGSLVGYTTTTAGNNSLGAYVLSENILTLDFGYRGTGALGDKVWLDANGNGTLDTGETGLGGVGVTLEMDFNRDGVFEPFAATTTDAAGLYTFSSLPGGSYRATVASSTLPGGVVPTYDLDGIATTNVALANLSYGQMFRSDVDFGYRGTGMLGDLAWLDRNASGTLDAGEPGLAGVKVTLGIDANLDGIFESSASTTTNATGWYTFVNLLAGGYRVTVDTSTLPGGVAASYDLDGIATANVATTSLSSGQMVRDDVDFGYQPVGVIGDQVWLDGNGNGTLDTGEGGLSGVKVTLDIDTNGDGVFESSASTTTSAIGWYTFVNLMPGDYRTTIDTSTLPGGLAPSFDLDGTATPNVATTSLTAAQMTRDDVDFGYRPSGSIGDLVWLDANGSGALDSGETGLAGVKVTLGIDANLDGTFEGSQTATTNTVGWYGFANLLAGSYRLTIDNTTLPAGLSATYDLDGVATPNVASTSLTAAQMTRDDVDFGYRPSGTIGDLVWLDANGNGALDSGEAGLAGVKISLEMDLNRDGVFEQSISTITYATGWYTFANLMPGSYRATVDTSTLPGGVAPSYDLDGIATPNAAMTSLTATQMTRTDVDFAYRGVGTIGDLVWLDSNGSGTVDAGEAGLAGVSVTLGMDVNRDGVFEQSITTTTSSTGWYTFSNLEPGSYRATVDTSTLPGGLAPSFDLDGIATPNVATTGLTAAQMTRDDVDFGYRPSGSIGDLVWLDANGSGALDSGETGLAGVKVTLDIDANVDGTFEASQTTTTIATGWYGFANLLAGSYRLTIDNTTLPAGLSPTYDLDGIATPNVATTSLTAAQMTRDDVDFGYRPSGSIGDLVWLDANGSGALDSGETGLASVKVTLGIDANLDGTFEASQTTTTNATGWYGFANLLAGSYRLTIDNTTLPAGLSATYDLDGIATPNVATTSLTAAQMTRDDVDFGYRPSGSIGDLVWLDANGSGALDSGETGLAGVKVTLGIDANVDGTFEGSQTTTTNATGWYGFANLLPGSYRLTIDATTLPAGLSATYDLDGIATPNVATTSLTAAQMTRDDLDFGYRPAGSIGDLVWLDANGNGTLDSGETGLATVKVTLRMDLNGDGTYEQSATTTTNATGAYAFTNLLPGSYRATVDTSTLPGGVTPTHDLDGIATPNVAATSLTAAQMTRNDVDFGYRPAGSIGDLVWLDTNGNGTLDSGETGLATVKVTLQMDLNGDGTYEQSATTTTNATGAYAFTNLLPGSYRATVDTSTLPGGVTPTHDLDGTATANVAATSLTAAQMTRDDVDFGYRPAGALGDNVWLDVNGNGTLDTGESGLAGVKVTLGIDVNRDGTFESSQTTTTNATGWYEFTNLFDGNYRVTVDVATLPGGLTATYDLDGTATPSVASASLGGGSAGTSSLGAGLTRNDVDFGYRGSGSIGDQVWLDSNGNGALDNGETGLAGVTVTLGIDLNRDAVFESSADTTTNAAGLYSFTGLLEGSYRVTVDASTLPAGLAATYDSDGTGTPNVASASLTSALMTRSDVDFGYRGNGSLGDQVWLDSDGNNSFDPVIGEIGLAGVKVKIDIDANRDGVFESSATTTTNSTGGYTFTNLPAGSFRVSVDASTLPAGLTPSFDLDGASTAHVALASLADGQMTRSDVDFAYRKTNPPGGRTPGYWKNHASAWPVAGVTLGGRHYDKAAAIALMEAPTKTDVTYSMVQGLIAAKLNVGDGVPAQSIAQTIRQADEWMAAHPAGSGVKGGGNDSPWRIGQPLYQAIDNFNNGR